MSWLNVLSPILQIGLPVLMGGGLLLAIYLKGRSNAKRDMQLKGLEAALDALEKGRREKERLGNKRDKILEDIKGSSANDVADKYSDLLSKRPFK